MMDINDVSLERPLCDEVISSAEPEDCGADDQSLAEMKERDCLRCGNGFSSTWAGERVCKACKSSTAWRGGLAA